MFAWVSCRGNSVFFVSIVYTGMADNTIDIVNLLFI